MAKKTAAYKRMLLTPFRPNINTFAAVSYTVLNSTMSKTELMDIGEHCSFCGQIDFLPFKCDCNGVFCLQHRQKEQHGCTAVGKTVRKTIDSTLDTSHLPPAASLFPDRNNVKHELRTDVPTTLKEKALKDGTLAKLKRLFDKTTGKTNATKRIVEQAKLRSSARGDSKVPASERVHLWCQVVDTTTTTHNRETRNAVFVSRGWPLGRALDSMATTLGVNNVNNRAQDDTQRLFLYRQHAEGAFVKMATSDRCSVLTEASTVFLVRGTAV